MAKIAPTYAPTPAPTGWKDHWHNYHDPRPVPVRGKIHWDVTKPVPLQKGSDKSKKLSSGTSDLRVAEERKWDLTAKIYQWFDNELEKLDTPQARFDRFMLEAEKLWAGAVEKINPNFLNVCHYLKLMM